MEKMEHAELFPRVPLLFVYSVFPKSGRAILGCNYSTEHKQATDRWEGCLLMLGTVSIPPLTQTQLMLQRLQTILEAQTVRLPATKRATPGAVTDRRRKPGGPESGT